MNAIPMRVTRYQAAIVRDGKLLLLQHTEHDTESAYWLLPGGGIEPGETEEACVIREAREETGLDVRVERLLTHEPFPIQDFYRDRKTYLCSVLGGEAAPGYDPEPFAIAMYGITAVRWIALDAPDSWGADVRGNTRLMPQLARIADQVLRI